MSKGAADRWARKKWYCYVCFIEVAQGHRARHQKTAAHLLAEKNPIPYEVKESDKKFSRFLAKTGPHVLTGFEQGLLITMMHPELKSIFEEDDCVRGPHVSDLTDSRDPSDQLRQAPSAQRTAA